MSIEITGTLDPLAAGSPGHVPAGQNALVADSKVVDITAGIAAGLAVVRSSTDGSVDLAVGGDADADGNIDVYGFVAASGQQTLTFSGSTAEAVDDFADGDAVTVVRRGRIFVASEDAATDGGAVFLRVVASGSEVLGAVRATDDSTDTFPLIGWVFRGDSSGTDNLVEIERR